MVMTDILIPDIWRQLSRKRPPVGELEAQRITQAPGIFLAISHDDVRHVLLKVDSERDHLFDDRSRGLLVTGRSLQIQGQPLSPFIDVACTDRNGHEAFDMVVQEIIARVVGGMQPAKAVTLTLDHWRRFWGASLNGLLSVEQVHGLFGELWFLSIWLFATDAASVAHWEGPTGARHDFQWPNRSVEVKATMSTRGHIHHIHGLDQLEEPDNGPLYLFSLRMREEAGSRNSLPSLVQRIQLQLSGQPALLDLFEERLAQVGYSPAHAEHYDRMRFRVVEERLYRVAADFPRIRTRSFAAGVPAGVEAVTYVINLETCAHLCVARSPDDSGARQALA